MAGGILQLFVYGAEDIYLTGSPQITFFKTVFRRHTSFSIETIKRDILDNPTFGRKTSVLIHRLGDLMTNIVLKLTISGVTPDPDSKFAWVRRLGHAIIRHISIKIGGQTIDKQPGTWLDVWWQLARQGKHERGYRIMIGDVECLIKYDNSPKPQYEMFIPLKFWFNRFQGLALPLIAIQYHEIYLDIEFTQLNKLIVTSENFAELNAGVLGDIRIENAELLIDYVYLDLKERNKFANIDHEYLIEQVQFTGEESTNTKITRLRLLYNYPTKELIWALRNGNYISNKRFLCYTHEDDWSDEILRCARRLLDSSVSLQPGPVMGEDQYGNPIVITPSQPPVDNGLWEEFAPGTSGRSMNNRIIVTNNSIDMSFWINTSSMLYGTYNLTSKIRATIEITSENIINVQAFSTSITERDISIPVRFFDDTRLTSNDVFVNQFHNYGTLITGNNNSIRFSLLEFNDQERFQKRGSKFFNFLQPEMHHNNTPSDGINVYSFALYPERHQPSGTANLSKIEKTFLTLCVEDPTQEGNLPDLDLLNKENQIYVMGLNYNILKVMNGLVALAYTD